MIALTGGTLNLTRIKHLATTQARTLAFVEMELAHQARHLELLAPPAPGTAWDLATPHAAASDDADHLWTPSTTVEHSPAGGSPQATPPTTDR